MCCDARMILKVKIKSSYMRDIMYGSKRTEFRQFKGDDILEMTDENGKTATAKILGMTVCDKKKEKAVRQAYSDIVWADDEPIMELIVAPRTRYSEYMDIDAGR